MSGVVSAGGLPLPLLPCMKKAAQWPEHTSRSSMSIRTGDSCRDFFLFTALKERDRLTRPEGLRDEPPTTEHAPEAFQRWARGQTGFPFVDACMRELAATGYMSNRGRQNVSNFLCKVFHTASFFHLLHLVSANLSGFHYQAPKALHWQERRQTRSYVYMK